jgi:Mlc titration factor MtfA (ptsG expression regulator)
MLFYWLRQRRRRRILSQPFPEEWLSYLRRNVTLYRRLSEDEQARLRDDLRIFIAEKDWEGCAGLEMTDEIKVTVAALACLLLLGIEHDYFSRVQTILVYPGGYRVPQQEALGENVIIEGESDRAGEAHYRGPVILSWDEVLHDARHPGAGRNLVIHEFAHQLDMLDGAIDGTPPLRSRRQYRRWHKVMTAEYRRLIAEAEESVPTLLDEYGTTSESEFFAVATECFFDRPVAMAREHPRLYALLRDYFGQDPAARRAGRAGASPEPSGPEA